MPVNETPVNQPTPLGEQAPPKPPGQDSNKRPSRPRGAAERVRPRQAGAGGGGEGAAQARQAGHGPQPAARADGEGGSQADKAEQPAERPQRYREGGKFARDPAKAQPASSRSSSRSLAASSSRSQIKPLDENAPYREPPGRFSEQAKAEWHAAPESVRGAVLSDGAGVPGRLREVPRRL